LGETGAGKSTLTNYLLGAKLSYKFDDDNEIYHISLGTSSESIHGFATIGNKPTS
jgi:ABC-type uncharacterized transport system ATPase subunit